MSAAVTPGDFKVWRRQLLGKAHIGKKALGLDDDAWRDLLQLKFGVQSSANLDVNQLGQLVEHLKSLGFRDSHRAARRPAPVDNSGVSRETIKGPTAPIIGKLRAQWMSLYHLGAVRDPKDSALLAFVARQTKAASADGKGVRALSWLTAQQAYKAIEALKEMGTRAGVDWTAHKDPRACVLEAQARKAVELRVLQYPEQLGARAYSMFGISQWRKLTAEHMDALIKAMGAEIRSRLPAEAPAP